MPQRKPKTDKEAALRAQGALNPHPERVTDPLFAEGDFFDARDVVQVKYEMLRRVRVDGQSVTRAAEEFGVTRPTFYKARDAFEEEGVSGLVPRKRGPKGPHKLDEEVMAFLQERVVPGEPIRARGLARQVEEQLGVTVHPRTIERALQPAGKKTP